MKIAVTGSSGFIGRATKNWAQIWGHEVIGFDRPHNDVLGDLSLLKADAVIHLAGMLGTAELFDEAEEAVRVNVIGTLRVLEHCAAKGISYVGITMPPVFPSVYTATKMCSDRLTTAWNLAKGLRTSKVRAFNAYGPHQKYGHGHPQKIIPTFAIEAWHGRPIPIWGDGMQTVDLVHADDLGRMLVEATRYGGDEIFDGGTGVAMTVNKVAEMVLTITGSKAGTVHLPMRAGETPTHIVATGEGWDKLGWKPINTFERIEHAVLWYRDAP